MQSIMTTGTLTRYSEAELWALHQRLNLKLNSTEPDSPERRIILASLENIIRVINFKRCQKPKPPGF